VSFVDSEAVMVTAEAHHDIFRLVMTSVSNVPKITIEAKPSLAEHELGRNAHDFQKIVLTFPDFDGGFQSLLSRLGV
jgi:predicted acetyltransferase